MHAALDARLSARTEAYWCHIVPAGAGARSSEKRGDDKAIYNEDDGYPWV